MHCTDNRSSDCLVKPEHLVSFVGSDNDWMFVICQATSEIHPFHTHTHTHKEKEKEKCIPLFCIKQESKHHKKLSMSVSNLVLVCWLLQQEFVQYRHLFIGIIEINLINKVIAYSIYCYCCCLSPFFTPSFFLVFKLNLEQTNSDFIGPQIAFSF